MTPLARRPSWSVISRSGKGAARAAVLMTLGLAAAGAAHAGAGMIEPTVLALTPGVTYSRSGFDSHLGYEVRVANVGGNTVNDIVFSGTLTRAAGGALPSLALVDGATCTTTATARALTVSCALGQLAGGSAAPTFRLYFRAPSAGGTSGTDTLGFAGSVLYAEGLGGVPKSKPKNSIVDWSADMPVALAAQSTSGVSTVVLRNGKTIATGADGAVSADDLFATRVVVPPAGDATTASIAEAPAVDGPCDRLLVCYRSTIAIRNLAGVTQRFDTPLEITLAVSAGNLKGGPGTLKQVLISYDDVVVGDCATGPVANPDGVPCIAARELDIAGNFVFRLLNFVNGSYKVF